MKIADVCDLFIPCQDVLIKDKDNVDIYIGSILNIPTNLKDTSIEVLYTEYIMCERPKECSVSVRDYLVIRI